jgi:protease-4
MEEKNAEKETKAAPAKGRRFGVGCLWALVILLAIVAIFSLLINAALIAERAPSAMKEVFTPYKEKIYSGEGDDKIALIEAKGILVDQSDAGFFGMKESMVQRVKRQIRQAAEDEDVKAILLRVESPGGGITESNEIHKELLKFKETKKKVVVSMGNIAASGGYYIAAPADLIVVQETTITGSIGVIAQMFNISKLLKRWDIEMITIKSGANKDLMNPFAPTKEEHKKIIQDLISGMYEKFLAVVSEGRKHVGLKPEDVRKLADGRIYAAKEALDLKLVDKVGFLDDAIEETKKLCGLEEATVIKYHKEKTFADLFQMLAPSAGVRIQLDLSPDSLPQLQTPKFMYLWTPDLGGK